MVGDRSRDDLMFYPPAWESSDIEVGNDGEEGQGEEWESHVQTDVAVEQKSRGMMSDGWVDSEEIQRDSTKAKQIQFTGRESSFIPFTISPTILALRPQLGINSSLWPPSSRLYSWSIDAHPSSYHGTASGERGTSYDGCSMQSSCTPGISHTPYQ